MGLIFFFNIGDSGYPLEPWLLTPVNNPTTNGERKYNTAHCKTRNIVERSFGLLKSRFRCLSQSGGTLLYKPEKVCRIVVACAVLHNFCITRGIMHEPEDLNVEVDEGLVAAPTHNIPQGVAVRRHLIETIFN